MTVAAAGVAAGPFNSFTYGALAPGVQNFRPGSVTDLNGSGIGGVPALFKAFTQQAGLHYNVHLETQPGSNRDFHYDNRRPLIDRRWDEVVMHGQSNLDFAAPNNPAKITTYTGILGTMFQAHNADVTISTSPRPGRAPTSRTRTPAAPGTASRSRRWRSTCTPATSTPRPPTRRSWTA